LITHVPWVIAAGVIGGVGNEIVARYRIRVGRRIGSEALIVDGQHARTDALTSLAVVAAGVGAALNVSWVDPVAGLLVAVPIVWLLMKSARRMLVRLVDGIDPEIVEEIAVAMRQVEGVAAVGDLRARWNGHQLRIAASVAVDPELTVRQGHDIAHDVEHELHHRFSSPVVAVIHVEPSDDPDPHRQTAHHLPS
jgi:cation diffusion facilitator family transporter